MFALYRNRDACFGDGAGGSLIVYRYNINVIDATG